MGTEEQEFLDRYRWDAIGTVTFSQDDMGHNDADKALELFGRRTSRLFKKIEPTPYLFAGVDSVIQRPNIHFLVGNTQGIRLKDLERGFRGLGYTRVTPYIPGGGWDEYMTRFARTPFWRCAAFGEFPTEEKEMEDGIVTLSIEQIIQDEEIQPRKRMNEGRIKDYVEGMLEGKLPPPDVYKTTEGLLLGDGWHRIEAAKKAGLTEVQVNLITGTRQDAILHAFRANVGHGLPLSNAEKREALQYIMEVCDLSTKSSREIADLVGNISHTFVQKVRREMSASDSGVPNSSPSSPNGSANTTQEATNLVETVSTTSVETKPAMGVEAEIDILETDSTTSEEKEVDGETNLLETASTRIEHTRASPTYRQLYFNTPNELRQVGLNDLKHLPAGVVIFLTEDPEDADNAVGELQLREFPCTARYESGKTILVFGEIPLRNGYRLE